MAIAEDEIRTTALWWVECLPDHKITGPRYSLIDFGTTTHTFCHVQWLLVC
jgi:hypothetical protein